MNEYGGTLRVFLTVSISVFIALLLTVLPLPDWLIWFRPRWVALVVIFWALVLPYRFGVASAWVIGLILDLVQGTLIGQQALTLSLIAYVVIKFHLRIQLFSLPQRVMVVFGLVLFYQLVQVLIQSLVLGQLLFKWYYLISPVISAFLWPWVCALLKGWQKRCRVLDPSLRGLHFGRDA